MKRYLEYRGSNSENKSNESEKFWEGTLEGSNVIVRWGKIGIQGQTQIKEFGSPAEASAQLDKMAAEKIRKGYIES